RCWRSTGSTGSRRGSASPRRRWPSRSPASSTARSSCGWATATTSWWSVPAPIGCLHVRLARANGAKKVFLVDLNRGRLDMSAAAVQPDAAICGAEVDTIDEVKKLTDGRGVDVVITAAAAGRAQEDGLQ